MSLLGNCHLPYPKETSANDSFDPNANFMHAQSFGHIEKLVSACGLDALLAKSNFKSDAPQCTERWLKEFQLLPFGVILLSLIQ